MLSLRPTAPSDLYRPGRSTTHRPPKPGVSQSSHGSPATTTDEALLLAPMRSRLRRGWSTVIDWPRKSECSYRVTCPTAGPGPGGGAPAPAGRADETLFCNPIAFNDEYRPGRSTTHLPPNARPSQTSHEPPETTTDEARL